MHRSRRVLGLGALMAAGALALTSCASTETPDAGGNSEAEVSEKVTEYGSALGDITPFCGDKETKVAFANGTDNAWSQLVFAELEDEASKCDNITEVRYVTAQDDQERAIGDMASLTAQGYNVIVTMPTFGESQLPSIREATGAGASVVPFVSNPGGTAGEDYVAYADFVRPLNHERQAQWVGEHFPDAKVVFLGGTPGAQSSLQSFTDIQAATEEFAPNITWVEDRVVDTDWDSAKKKQVMSALLATHGRIDVIFSDYGTTDMGAIDAYLEAGLEPPALVTVASGNGIGCMWEENNFPYFSIDGDTAVSRLALRLALADYQGIENNENPLFALPVSIDTFDDMNPKCDPALPFDASLYSTLDPDVVAEIFS